MDFRWALLRYRMTIDNHAAARDWIAGAIAARRSVREGSMKGIVALLASQPSAGGSTSPLSFHKTISRDHDDGMA